MAMLPNMAVDLAPFGRWTLQQRRLAQDAFPISDALLESLFEAVEAQVENSGCDHTLQFTRAWIAEHEQPEAEILA